MSKEILNILKYNSEGPNIDFKQKAYQLGKYEKKNDLLKDLMSFANHPSEEDKYIVLGVKAKNGMASRFFEIEESLDDSNYQEFVNMNVEPEIQFEYSNFKHDGKLLGLIRIYGNKQRPYLFKNDVKVPQSNQIEYRVGDGYIRVGSSTRKMTRKDFEAIYKIRYKSADRKSDLVIQPIVGIPNDDEFQQLGLRYLDIEILNNSNKSIELEVELEVYKSDHHDLLTEKEAREVLRQIHEDSHSFLGVTGSQTDFSNPFISSKKKENSILLSDISINPYRLAQNDSIKDIFGQAMLFRVKRMEPIRAKVTVRSDDFSEGPLKKDLIFDIPNIDLGFESPNIA